LENFRLPADLSASDRYFQTDLIDPPVTLNKDGTITVPVTPGLGFAVNLKRVEDCTARKETFRR